MTVWLAATAAGASIHGAAKIEASLRAGNLGPNRVRIIEDSRFASVPPLASDGPLRHTTFESTAHGAFGFALGGVGDLDGDGFGEVAIAAPRFGEVYPEAGRVLVFRGGREGVHHLDIVVFPGLRPGAQLGRSLSESADFDLDGTPEFLVGSTQFTGAAREGGGVFLLHGGRGFETGLRQVFATGAQGASLFGASVAIAGDVNRDGRPDVLVGAPNWKHSEAREGAAYLFLGSPEGFRPAPDWSTFGGQAGAGLGTAVGGVGDLNRDGFDDVAIGVPHHHEEVRGVGRVLLFFGSRTGLRASPDWSFSGTMAREGVGNSIAARGDLNGDGQPDLVVGAPGNGEKSGVNGRVYVFLGPVTGPQRAPDHVLEGGQSGDGFGFSVALIDDVSGNASRGLLVGSPYHRNDIRGQGRAYLYVLEKSSGTLQPRALFDGPTAQSRFGWSVARAGDVNGDGLADFLIGSPYLDDGAGTIGRVDLIYGSRSSFAQPRHFAAVAGLPGQPLPSPALIVTNVIDAAPSEALVGAASRTRRWATGAVVASLVLAAVLMVWLARRQRRAARLAVQQERERMARDLHDQVAPELTRITLLDSPAASDAARQALDSVGELVWATNPKNDRLEQFIAFLGDYTVRSLEPADIRVDLDLPAVPPGLVLDARVRQQLLSIAKEALHNIVKHSGAQAVRLSVRLDGRRLQLEISDDGRGFDPSSIRPGANGLESMRARASQLGGTLRISSAGQGTQLCLKVEV